MTAILKGFSYRSKEGTEGNPYTFTVSACLFFAGRLQVCLLSFLQRIGDPFGLEVIGPLDLIRFGGKEIRRIDFQ